MLLSADGYCDPSPVVERATKNTTLAAAGTVVRYQCDIGYRFNKGTSDEITCDGVNWSTVEPACQGNSIFAARRSALERLLLLATWLCVCHVDVSCLND